MAMCTNCGTENHESLDECLYCGASLSFKSIHNQQFNSEILANPEHRERIFEDQFEKLSKTKLIYIVYLLALLFPFIILNPRIGNIQYLKKFRKIALFGSFLYGIVTVIILLNEFEIISL
jgi:uncharacterized membrane protein YvbJ